MNYEDEIKRLTHERDVLAGAIRDAAVKSGICREDACLTGPHLLMLCEDMSGYIHHLTTAVDVGGALNQAEQILTLAHEASRDGEHIYSHPRDHNNWQANEAWLRAARPELFIALVSALRRAVAKGGAGSASPQGRPQ